jgi:hypothetical protein
MQVVQSKLLTPLIIAQERQKAIKIQKDLHQWSYEVCHHCNGRSFAEAPAEILQRQRSSLLTFYKTDTRWNCKKH